MTLIAARRYSATMHGSASEACGSVDHLVDRHPTVSPVRLIAQLRPPPTFAEVSFATYRPDPVEPTQAAAVVACQDFAGRPSSGVQAARNGSASATCCPVWGCTWTVGSG